MLSNSSNTSGNVAPSSVFSTRYSLLIQLYDFNHLNDKVEKYESHDAMPTYLNYGFTVLLKTMNSQGNDGTYELKRLLSSFTNKAEMDLSEATHKADNLKIKVAEQEEVIYKMQKQMHKYSLEDYEAENDTLHALEGRRLAQLKIKEECEFLDEITDKIYKRVSEAIFKTLSSDSVEWHIIQPKITQDTEKLFDYIFEYNKQLEIISNSDMADFETTEKELENDDTDPETDSDDSDSVCSHDFQVELIIERNDYKTKYEEAQKQIEKLKNEKEYYFIEMGKHRNTYSERVEELENEVEELKTSRTKILELLKQVVKNN